ncbi:MAG: alpha-galactosidase [Oscillospiraceae bacterium]|nr:alpha-galactosidase [Oscillospiraceae bacterium]
MKIAPMGILCHQYYGRRIRATDLSYLDRYYDRGFSGPLYEYRRDRTPSLDTLPQEYTSCGVGDYRINSIDVINADGSQCADFRYVGHEIRAGKYAIPGMPSVYDNGGEMETLIVTLQDPVTRLTLRLYYGVLYERDVITRCAELINEGTEPIVLNKAASLCLDLPCGDWDLMHFYGRHCLERQVERSPLPHSIQTISSTRGMTSHHHNCFAILCDHQATEDDGACCGMMLVYSGSHKIEIEQDQMESVRVVMGIHDQQFSWRLEAGASFFTPECILSYSADGLAQLSHNFHDTLRHNVCRGRWKLERRPVLINSWEATYCDFDDQKILRIARQAAALGVELFVLDDGWFGVRDDDNQGLGDWYVNRRKLPDGLAPVIRQINEMGMKFGLWMEPEMVSEDSDLYRAHPDWALTVPGRKPMMGRNQLALDLSRQDVRDYLYGVLSDLLRENHIEYIKWDMNRCISDVFSRLLPSGRQGEVGHRYVLGVYDLLERLTGEFPDILVENCAGGGGRFDAAMLAFSPQIWCSDDTDAVERVRIQYGTSFGYPVSTMGSHVSASPNHQTGRTTPLHTRGIVAMSGTFGYELDPTTLTEAEREEVRRQIADFKRYYWLIQDGRYYRLTDPMKRNDFDAWQFAARDGSEALLNLIVNRTQANAQQFRIRWKGLDPDGFYRIEGEDTLFTGDALMYGGYAFPLMSGDYPAVQLHLVRVEEA